VEPFEKFIGRIEWSINHFRATKPQGTFREAHDWLRKIWLLSHEDDPSPALLRVRLKSLPSTALEQLGRRARDVLPRLFPGEAMEGDPFEPSSCFVTRFLTWAERAEGSDLVKALKVISADGGRRVPGRSRGDGKRSTERLEPQVLGRVRGSPGPHGGGGRPSENSRQELVMNLATDWHQAIGQSPERGRSDQTGFGELVHSIFGWLDISKDPYEAAAYTLRRFWEQVEKRNTRSTSADLLERCDEDL